MGWFTKMVGIDKVVSQQIQNALQGAVIPTSVANPQLLEYRSKEYRVWASSNADALLTFYKQNAEPTTHADRLMFWQWVGGINVPKLHYPAPEIILSHIKGILFSSELNIEMVKDDASDTEVDLMNDRLTKAIDDINFDEFTSNGSLFETYSGSVAIRVVMDKAVHDKPILQQYPRERFEVKSKYGKTIEIIFDDEYYKGNKTYVLRSFYGKGYIKYKLYEVRSGKPKEVVLSTLEDTKNLIDVTFKPGIILATWKKNKTVSNEFPELPYGGSDFEGVTDIFHSIDEMFSTLMIYIRRSRPMMFIDESLIPYNSDGTRTVIPKEFEFDLNKFRNNESNQNKIFRDNPQIETSQHMATISELMLSIYQKIQISHASINDSGIGANASGESIAKREKSTTIMRDSKIKLWIPYIKEVLRLYLACEELMDLGTFTPTDFELNTYDAYKDWTIKVEFPEYNGQTFKEKVEELAQAKQAGLIDTALAVDKLYGRELTEDEKRVLVTNAKLESGQPLLQEDVIET